MKTLSKPSRTDGDDSRKAYQSEKEQLITFNGIRHPHLITLLTSFKHGKRYKFLFPCAEDNLAVYMEKDILGKDLLSAISWSLHHLNGLVKATSTSELYKSLPSSHLNDAGTTI